MPRVTPREDPTPELPPTSRFNMLRQPLPAGQLGDVRVHIGASLPVAFVTILAAGWWFRTRPGNADLPVLAGILAVSLVGGAVYQALIRIWVCKISGGQAIDVTLRAFGSWGRVSAPASRRLLIALAVPALTLGLAAALAAMPPRGAGWQGFALLPPELTGRLTAASVLIGCIWVLTIQAAAQTLPLPGCHGREALIATVDLLTRRTPERRSLAVRLALGITATAWLVAAMIALVIQPQGALLLWPWLALIGIACWSSRTAAVDLPVPPPSSASGARLALATHPALEARPDGDNRPASGVRAADDFPVAHTTASPWRSWKDWKTTRRLRAVRQAEIGEAVDDRRLDAILERLHQYGLNSLSAADRAVLKRVSRRLRSRQNK